MTLRMDLAYVALAALALLIADVAAARAAMRSCNAEPQRCRYSSDGRQYFHAYGSRTAAGGTSGEQPGVGLRCDGRNSAGPIMELSDPGRGLVARSCSLRKAQSALPHRQLQPLHPQLRRSASDLVWQRAAITGAFA